MALTLQEEPAQCLATHRRSRLFARASVAPRVLSRAFPAREKKPRGGSLRECRTIDLPRHSNKRANSGQGSQGGGLYCGLERPVGPVLRYLCLNFRLIGATRGRLVTRLGGRRTSGALTVFSGVPRENRIEGFVPLSPMTDRSSSNPLSMSAALSASCSAFPHRGPLSLLRFGSFASFRAWRPYGSSKGFLSTPRFWVSRFPEDVS